MVVRIVGTPYAFAVLDLIHRAHFCVLQREQKILRVVSEELGKRGLRLRADGDHVGLAAP